MPNHQLSCPVPLHPSRVAETRNIGIHAVGHDGHHVFPMLIESLGMKRIFYLTGKVKSALV